MPIHNPLAAAAKESIAMSKETGDQNFKLLAMVMMGVSGIAAIMHAGHVIWRDLKPAREKARDTPEPIEERQPAVNADERHRDEPPQRSWVHKARVAERAEGPKAWTEHASRHGHARQH